MGNCPPLRLTRGEQPSIPVTRDQVPQVHGSFPHIGHLSMRMRGREVKRTSHFTRDPADGTGSRRHNSPFMIS